MDASSVYAERTASGGADRDYSGDVALSESAPAARRAAAAAARTGGDVSAVRVSKADRDAEARRVASKSQAFLSAVYREWAYGTDQAAQEDRAAIAGGNAQGHLAQLEVEHGLQCAMRAKEDEMT